MADGSSALAPANVAGGGSSNRRYRAPCAEPCTSGLQNATTKPMWTSSTTKERGPSIRLCVLPGLCTQEGTRPPSTNTATLKQTKRYGCPACTTTSPSYRASRRALGGRGHEGAPLQRRVGQEAAGSYQRADLALHPQAAPGAAHDSACLPNTQISSSGGPQALGVYSLLGRGGVLGVQAEQALQGEREQDACLHKVGYRRYLGRHRVEGTVGPLRAPPACWT